MHLHPLKQGDFIDLICTTQLLFGVTGAAATCFSVPEAVDAFDGHTLLTG